MPKTKTKTKAGAMKKPWYEVRGIKFQKFADAAARAVDLSLQSEGDDENILEHGTTGNYYIDVRAAASRAE